MVTIEGKKNTPQAGFRLTIAVSLSNGGEFVMTEFEHAKILADDPTGEHEEIQRRKEALIAAGNCWGGDRDSQIPGTNWNDPELVVRTDAVATTKAREGRSRVEPLAQVPDKDSVGASSGGEEAKEESCSNESKAARAELVRQDATGAHGWKGRSNPHEEVMEVQALSSGDGEGDNASSNPRLTPVPPKNTLTSPLSQRFGQGVLAVKRFARSVVRSATDDSSRNNANDVTVQRGDARAANADSAEIQAEGDDIEKPALAREGRGGVATGIAAETQDLDPPAGTLRRGSAGTYIKGFRPVREAVISMTCPLPSVLPFHPTQTEEEFTAPNFGVTVLGNSHGFDPNG